MHIEPGVVEGAKIVLSYATAAASCGLAGKMVADSLRQEPGIGRLSARAAMATGLVFTFFQVFPHHAVGVSEVHLILGTTLFLLFGAGPAAVGLALGLLTQGLFFAPADLPQFGMNLTTLLVPLFAMSLLARRIIPARLAYADVSYAQALKLSLAFQGGIVGWVAFWVLYGQGVSAHTVASIGSFAAAYAVVIVVEPLADLAVLAAAKALRGGQGTGLLQHRLYHAA